MSDTRSTSDTGRVQNSAGSGTATRGFLCRLKAGPILKVFQLLTVLKVDVKFDAFVRVHSVNMHNYVTRRYRRRSTRLTPTKTLTHGDASCLPTHL